MIEKLYHVSSSDVLVSVRGDQAALWLVSLEDGDNFRAIAKFGTN